MNIFHEKTLNLLKEIDSICRKYGIVYYAAGGTTIGAIRHGGFIPWDDDADIYMTRDNFNKFVHAFEKEKMPNRELGCVEENRDYAGTIPRYIDTNSTCITRYNITDTCAAGILIDIFILDPVSSDKEEQRRHINMLNVYSDFVMPFYGYSYRNDDDYMDHYAGYKTVENLLGRERTLGIMETDLFSCSEEECDYYILRWGTVPHIFKKEIFGTPVYKKFEDFSVPLPERWFDYLVQLYGLGWTDYPPFIQDESHVSVIDFETPYTVYVEDYADFIKEDVVENSIKRKNYLIKRETLARPHGKDSLQQIEKYVRSRIDKRLEESAETLDELFASKKNKEIVDIFEKFTYYQFSPLFIGKMAHVYTYAFNNPYLITLSDYEYYVLLVSYLALGKFREAKKLFELLEKYERIEDNRILSLKNNFDKLIEAVGCFYYEDYQKTLNLTDELLKCDDLDIVLLHETRLKALLEINRADCSAVLSEIDNNIEKYGETSTLLKLKADGLLYCDKIEEAKTIYSKVLETTRNGVIIQDIHNKVEIDSPGISESVASNFVPTSLCGQTYFEMLQEIDVLCRDNGIEYSLSGDTLAYAYYYGTFKSEVERPSLVMTAKNAKKFVSAFNKYKKENRELSFLGAAVDEASVKLEYSNTKSVHYSFNNNRAKSLSVCIDVFEKEYSPSIYKKWISLKKKIELFPVRKSKKIKRMIKYYVFKLIKAFCGGKRYNEKLFYQCVNNAIKSKKASVVFLTRKNKKNTKRVYFNEGILGDYKDISLYGYNMRCMEKPEEYIQVVYGKYADSKMKVRPFVPTTPHIIDTEMSINELEEILEGFVLDKLSWANYKTSKKFNRAASKLQKSFTKSWNVILRAESRIKLTRKYAEIKTDILAAFEERDFSELGMLLEEYDREVRWFADKGLCLCIDKHIFDVYCEYLDYHNEENLIKKLKSLLPEEHYVSLDGEEDTSEVAC